MYKVFIDNHPILFLKSDKTETNIPTKYGLRLSTQDFASFSCEVNLNHKDAPFYVKSPFPLEPLKHFFSDFVWIEAAGGIVENLNTNKLLFIHRNGFWDIPKGKIEANENPSKAAMREIQEECGLKKLNIVSSLSPTYHVYNLYGKYWIKKTHWFVLNTQETEVKPQTDEGITEATWFNKNNLEKVYENTFSSILEVLQEYKNKFPFD